MYTWTCTHVPQYNLALVCRFSELTSMVPDHIQRVPKCSKLLAVLEDIATYMCEVGPKKMSRKKLIQVLATRKPWELRNPDIAQAIEARNISELIPMHAQNYEKLKTAIICEFWAQKSVLSNFTYNVM